MGYPHPAGGGLGTNNEVEWRIHHKDHEAQANRIFAILACFAVKRIGLPSWITAKTAKAAEVRQ